MTQLVTSVSTVYVYPDRARVTRRGTIELKSGNYKLEVSELPLKLNPDSVRAAARGRAKARLLGVQMQRAFYLDTPDEEIHQLEEQIEALRDEVRGLEAEAELITHARNNLINLAAQTEIYATAVASGEMNLDDQMAIFERLRTQGVELEKQMLDVAARRRGLEKHLSKLTAELDRWRGTPRREAYTALIEVEVDDPGDLNVEFSYVVSNAGWQPVYDVRLREEDLEPRLEIGYLAQVKQQTGELWGDVSLTLSTARPALASVLPELDPWYVRPLPPRRLVPAAESDMAGAPASLREVSLKASAPSRQQPQREAETIMAEVEASGADITYRVPATVTIPADGDPHSVTVTKLGLKPEMDYVSTPKLVEAAYRRATVANTSQFTLLPGPANLFAGDEFIGSTRMALVPPQGEIELYFGTDDRLKVERELKRREVDKRLIGARRRLRYGYGITIENLLPGEAKISLHDQIPVPTHEDVKVNLESASPEVSERSELNELIWELTLAREEELTVRFDFSIEHPRDMDVHGLP